MFTASTVGIPGTVRWYTVPGISICLCVVVATVYTCFSSDFLLDAADEWRGEAWAMMRLRSDLHFFMITKRIDRLMSVVPDDWRTGYSNVTLCCTVENQERADYRLPLYS